MRLQNTTGDYAGEPAGSCSATATPTTVTATAPTPATLTGLQVFNIELEPTTSGYYNITTSCTVGGRPAGTDGPVLSPLVQGLPAPTPPPAPPFPFDFGS
ncbi:hypothetical protein [Rhodococcoides kroppenstedtii]|uniref:hypothetical protein n=1 Tax=Rhodococcoides kroppenstedtii TaxID=293050 RepID=UPI003626AA16